MKTEKVFQFKITLNDIQPDMWRRILVDADCTFFELHCVIQNAMGWTDGHLHTFHFFDNDTRLMPITIETASSQDKFGDKIIDERLAKVADYFGKLFKGCLYVYDFGDNWEHRITLEKTMSEPNGAAYPQYIAGKNACPPENCGGAWGYRNLLKILKNPKDTEHASMLKWLGIENAKQFDPTGKVKYV